MISVALCTYNGEQFLREQLKSILNQTLPPDEIVICDDCSTDKTVEIIKSVFSNDRWNEKLKIVVNSKNLGFRRNFEKAISLCTGDIIFLCDQDDVWSLNKIETIIGIFGSHVDAVLVFHDAEVVDENLKLLQPSFWKLMQFDYRHFSGFENTYLGYKNFVQGSACAFKKDLFEYAKPFPQDAYHDEWLALVAVQYGKIIPCPKCLLKYRQSSNNAIGADKDSFFGKINKWTSDYKHRKELKKNGLKRRLSVMDAYIQRFLNKKKLDNNEIFFMKSYSLVKKRTGCVLERNIFIIKYLPLYFRVIPFKPLTCLKTFILDFINVVL